MSTRAISTLIALTTLAAHTQAQCGTWDPSFGRNFTSVAALTTFDDGHGPALFVGGGFATIGGITADGLARWDGSSWSSLYYNSGYQDHFQALAVYDDGTGPALYAGGYFPHQLVQYPLMLKWNGGMNWTPLPGVGTIFTQSSVNALAVFDDGSGSALFAAGKFPTAGGMTVNNIARWNGTSWAALGDGLDAPVYSLAVFDDGSGPALYAGGAFVNAGGAPASHIAKWNGASWSPLANGVDGDVYTMTSFDDVAGHALFVGGAFVNASSVSAPHAARWNGTIWSALGAPGSGMNGAVDASVVFDAGNGPELYAGGTFSMAGGVSAQVLARWDGVSWSGFPAGSTAQEVYALCAFNDGSDGDADLYVGGYGIAEWHGCGTTAFCFGDGSAATCPCANNGQVGHGCDNSVASGGAVLTAHGTTSPDTLTFTQTGELSSSLSIFLQGNVELGAPAMFGDGLRCVGGSLLRLYAKGASSGSVSAPQAGDPSITARSALLGDPITSGTARFYQVYYRDPNLAFCPSPQGNTFNVGNALRIEW
jgi:hypothetical protein